MQQNVIMIFPIVVLDLPNHNFLFFIPIAIGIKKSNRIPRTKPETTMDSKAFWNDDLHMLTVVPPECGPTRPRVIIPVVDVSMSMDAVAKVRDSGKKMETEYTILDLVKYSLKVIAKSLQSDDMFGLVTFSDTAEMVIDPIKVSEKNEDYIMETIDGMRTIGMTNMWSGLKLAIETAKNHQNVSILLLTDGMPNSHPPLGYKDAFKRNPIMFDDVGVHVFTYGYSDMDTDLMFDISRRYNGTFNYISDPSMIGTVFVNTMANILSLACREIKCPAINASFGQLNYGQPRHFVLAENPQEILVLNTPIRVDPVPADFAAEKYHFHMLRRKLGELLNNFFNDKLNLESLKAEIKATNWDMSPLIKKDVEGEVTKALDGVAYDKWGKYYLRSLFSCHEREWRNNFFDESIQGYGCGMTFKEHARRLEEIFEKLPVQKPSRKRPLTFGAGPVRATACGYGGGMMLGSRGGSARTLSVSNMSETFMNKAAGCISGNTTVITNNGTYVKVKNLKAGDILSGNNEIINVVKGPPVPMIKYNGFWITPYHPVFNKGDEWAFPIEETKEPIKFKMVESSWNLITTSGSFYVLGFGMDQATKVIALGHGIVDDMVASHPYLGSDQVKEDVAQCLNYLTGQCEIRGFKRDPETGLLCGIYKNHKSPLI